MKVSGRFFDVYVQRARGLSPGKWWVVVGTKVSKKAVVRNKVKRRLREIMKLSGPGLNNRELRVVAKAASAQASFSELRSDISDLLGHL